MEKKRTRDNNKLQKPASAQVLCNLRYICKYKLYSSEKSLMSMCLQNMLTIKWMYTMMLFVL